MARQTIQIGSIFGGFSPAQYFTAEGQYLAGIGLDPDLPISDAVGDRLASGVLRPSGYAKFSSTAVNANPYWIITNPKDALIYAVLNNGKIVSYTSSFASETTVGTASTSGGNGAAYYNNYLYVAANTNISRYGPLSSSPSLTDSVWTGGTLGSQTALVNTTYPSIRGSGTLPNHVMHVHVDGALYVCDFDSTSSTAANRGKGLIHKIVTKYGSAEGDTNNGSAYNVLDLPFGYMPTCLASVGNDLVIGAIQTSNSTLIQGKAALFFWDTISDSFYLQVDLPDALVTAIKNINGILYIWTGNTTTGTDVSNGYRVSVYAGGTSIQQVYYSDVGSPPLAGAVEAIGDRVMWGTFHQLPTTTGASPSYYSVVMALASKNRQLTGGVHGIVNASGGATAADGMVTAIKAVQQSSFSYPKLAVGWRSASDTGIDNQSTTYGTTVFRSQMFAVGKKGIVRRIRMSLGAAVAANMTITPKLFLDDFSSSSTTGVAVINNTNYSASERHIQWYPDVSFDHNFCLELVWSGTALLPGLLPVEVEIESFND